jgi:hypothetical protein
MLTEPRFPARALTRLAENDFSDLDVGTCFQGRLLLDPRVRGEHVSSTRFQSLCVWRDPPALRAASAEAFAPRFGPPDQIAPSAPSLTPSVGFADTSPAFGEGGRLRLVGRQCFLPLKVRAA